MKTIKQIQEWMREECFNEYSYFIGDNQLIGHEGFVLKAEGLKYVFFYTERGQKDVIKEFATEVEACEFVYQKMKNNKWATSHLIGFLKSKDKALALCQELDTLGIAYNMDTISYHGKDDYRYRIFVFGCDEKITQQIKEKYKD